MSIAVMFRKRYLKNYQSTVFCYVTLRNKVKDFAEFSCPWGGDDVMYRFSDGSMLLDRTIVREFQILRK